MKEEIFKAVKEDQAVLRKVQLKLPNKDPFDLYFRPFTTKQRRVSLINATRKKLVKEPNKEEVEVTYVCDDAYQASIVYYQSLNKEGERIFTSLADIDFIRDSFPQLKLATLATIMGTDIENEMEEALK